jgi:hypothetical protein
MMRSAREAHGEAREQLRSDLAEFIAAADQLDLLEPGTPGARARSDARSEDVRTKRSASRK